MKVPAIDIGGTHIKLHVTGRKAPSEFASGPGLTPAMLIAALEPDDVVLGGGNIHKLKVLPPGCRAGDNDNAFLGGFRLWPAAGTRQGVARAQPRLKQRRETKVVVRNKT